MVPIMSIFFLIFNKQKKFKLDFDYKKKVIRYNTYRIFEFLEFKIDFRTMFRAILIRTSSNLKKRFSFILMCLRIEFFEYHLKISSYLSIFSRIHWTSQWINSAIILWFVQIILSKFYQTLFLHIFIYLLPHFFSQSPFKIKIFCYL